MRTINAKCSSGLIIKYAPVAGGRLLHDDREHVLVYAGFGDKTHALIIDPDRVVATADETPVVLQSQHVGQRRVAVVLAIHMNQGGSGRHGHVVAAATRVLTRHAENLAWRRQITRPVRLDHGNVALEAARGKNHAARVQFLLCPEPQVKYLHTRHFFITHQESLRQRVPAKRNIGVAQCLQVQRPCQVQAAPEGHVEPRHAVAMTRYNPIKGHTQAGEPIVEHFTGMLRVIARPLRITIDGPFHPVTVSPVRSVLIPQFRLHRRSCYRNAAGLDTVAAKYRVHVHNQNPGTTIGSFDGSGQSCYARTHNDDIGDRLFFRSLSIAAVSSK